MTAGFNIFSDVLADTFVRVTNTARPQNESKCQKKVQDPTSSLNVPQMFNFFIICAFFKKIYINIYIGSFRGEIWTSKEFLHLFNVSEALTCVSCNC